MNIFQLKEEFLYLMQDIEEAGGEITEEIAERLKVNSEDFANKMDAYASIIAIFTQQVATIKGEVERLEGLKATAERSIESMKLVMNTALELFGENGKSGNKTYKTALHSYWNVYHKPLVIADEQAIPSEFVQYDLKTHLPEEAMKDVADTLADYDLVALTFESSIKKKELKEAIESGLHVDGAYIDTKASYLRIK